MGLYAAQVLLCTRFGVKHVHYRCYFAQEEVTEGDTLDLIEEIENTGLFPLAWLRSEYAVPKYLAFAGTHSVITDRTRYVSSLFYLRPYSRIERRWHVECLRRGEYTVESVRLVTSDLLGTVRTAIPAEDLGGTLTVLPKCYDKGAFLLSAGSFAAGEFPVRHSLLTDPVTVNGSRLYSGREPLRRMDWKTTARTGKLMVRTEEPVQERRLCICFTAQTGEYGRRFVSEEVSEHTIRVAAALFRELTERGEIFSVQSNCTVHGEALQHLPDCSLGGYLALLRSLAALGTEPELSLRNVVTIPADARLVLLTPYLSEDIRRLKALYPGADVILTAPPETGEEMEFIPVYEEVQDDAAE